NPTHGPGTCKAEVLIEQQNQPSHQEAPGGPEDEPPAWCRFDVTDIATTTRASGIARSAIHGWSLQCLDPLNKTFRSLAHRTMTALLPQSLGVPGDLAFPRPRTAG